MGSSVAYDPSRDPLPIAQAAIDRQGVLPWADVVFLAHAVVEAHKKVDQLYDAIERRSDSTRSAVEQVLRDTAQWAPSTAACRDLRAALRTALDRGVVFVEDPDSCRLDWLAADDARLLDVRGRMVNEAISLREAIDGLMPSEALHA